MSENDTKESVVISLRTRNGENIIGIYVGEATQKVSDKRSIILYRPIRIKHIEYVQNGRSMQNYIHELYFPFGGALVEFLHEDLLHSELSSDFFTMFYKKILTEHIFEEETLQKKIVSHYEFKNVVAVMSEHKSTGTYFRLECKHLH